MMSTTDATHVVTTIGSDYGAVYAILPKPNERGIGWTYWWIIAATSPKSPSLRVPYWIPVLFAATLAAAPWTPWRFGLRSLLITTTLVAVLLGLAVWSLRS